MGAEGNRLLLIILACIVFLAPFGEGGAAPLALFCVQTLTLTSAVLALVLPSSTLPRNGPSRRVLVASAGFVALALLSCIQSPYPYASFLRLLDWLLLLGLFAISLQRPWREREKSLLADIVLGAAVLQASVVLFGISSGTSASLLRRLGLLNANHEAAYLLAAALLTVPRVDFRKFRGASAVRGGAVVLCMLAFVLLMSRGALLAMLVGAAVLLAYRWSSLAHKERLVTVMSLGLVLTAGAVALGSRFGTSVDPYRYGRLGIWGADLRCFAGHPLLGAGPGVFRHIASRFNFPLDGPVRFGRSFETPHSDYLGLLVEMGLLGFSAGLWLVGRALRSLAWLRRRGDRFAEGIMAALAALAAQGAVEDLTMRPVLMVTAAILLGACLAGAEGGPPVAQSPGPGDPARHVAALLGLALCWWCAIRNPYLAFVRDQAMRQSKSYRTMDDNFRDAIRLNPYQASTYLFPSAAFLATRPEVPLSLDLYARFRRDLDAGIRMDRVSADLRVGLARMEVRALRSLFHDSATRDRAIEAYRVAIRLAPHDPRIRVELATLLHEVGRQAEAARQLHLALQEEPNFLTARLLAIKLLLEEGNRPQAQASWEMAGKIRSTLSNYRADSAYASDISRDPTSLRTALEGELGPL